MFTHTIYIISSVFLVFQGVVYYKKKNKIKSKTLKSMFDAMKK